MIIKYKARMTVALILKVFFAVLVSSFASPSRALERISAVLGPSNSSVFGIERVRELSLQITESGDYTFDIVIFQDRTTSSKVKVGNAPQLNHIVTVQSQDEIVKWLSKNKPQIIICFAQDVGLHYTIVNARKKGLLSSAVKIISVLENVINYQEKYEQGNANLEKIAKVFIHSDLILFTAAKDQRFLEKELKNSKFDISNKALLQKVKSGVVLQHFSLIKDFFVLPHPKDTSGGNEVWIKQNRIRRDAPNQNLGDSNTTMVTYPTPSSTATLLVGTSQRAHPNMTYPTESPNVTVAASSTATAMVRASQTVHPNMTYPMPSSNATVATSSTSTVSPNMTYPTASSTATAMVRASQTVHPNATYPTPSSNATVATSSTPTVSPNMTYPTASSNDTVVTSSPTVHLNMTYPTASSNATVVTSSAPTVSPNMTYPIASSNATVATYFTPTVHPNMTYPTPSLNDTVVASSPTVSPAVSPNMTYPTASSNATVATSSTPTVHPNMTYPTPSLNETVVASSPTVSPTVSPNMTYLMPSSNATVATSSAPTVSPNMTYPTASLNATVVTYSAPTVSPNMTYPTASSNATVAASSAPTVSLKMTYPTASSNTTVAASSPTVHPNMTYPTPSLNATVAASSLTVHPNTTYPTPSLNATVIASSPTVYPNMTYPKPSSTVSLLFQTESLTINQTSSVEQPVVLSSTLLSVMTTVSFLYNQSSVRQTPSTAVVPFSSSPTLSTAVSLVINQSSSIVHPSNATIVVATSTGPLTSSVFQYFNETVILKTQAVTSLPSVFSTTLRKRVSSTFFPQATSTLLLSSSLSSTGFLSITKMATPSLSSVGIATPSSQAVLPQVTSSVVLATSSPTGLLPTKEATPTPSSVEVTTSSSQAVLPQVTSSVVVPSSSPTGLLPTEEATATPSSVQVTTSSSQAVLPQVTSSVVVPSSSPTGLLPTEEATPTPSSVEVTTSSSQAVLPQVTSSIVVPTSSPTGLLSTDEATPSPSSVQIVIPTSSITSGFTPSKNDERYLITFEGNCKDIAENDEKKNKFIEEFTKVITDILEITDNELQVEEIKCGSINVTFIVKNAKNRNTTVVLKKAVSEGNVIVRVDGTAYTSSGLVVIPSPEPTKPSTGVKPTTKPDNKLALYLYITFGAVMGLIFLIGLIILIIRCRRENTRGTFTLGSDTDVELKRFRGIPRASYYRVEMYGEPVEMDAARAGVSEDEYNGDIVPYAQTSFNSNTAAHSSNKANKDEFTMGNLPEWNVPKLSATDVVVSSPKRTSAAEQGDGEVSRDENANNDSLHAYDNPVMTFGEASNNSSE